MPIKPLKPCKEPSCKELTRNVYCDKHKWNNTAPKRSSNKMGYNYWWQKERKAFIERNPLCVNFGNQSFPNCTINATVVDHIVPHKGDESLFYDMSNWQPMCSSCHSYKTRTEDMGGWNGRIG